MPCAGIETVLRAFSFLLRSKRHLFVNLDLAATKEIHMDRIKKWACSVVRDAYASAEGKIRMHEIHALASS